MAFSTKTCMYLFSQMLFYICYAFNVTEVQELDESISKNIMSVSNKTEASRMQREITFYTGGMCGIVLNILDPFYEGNIKKICNDIFAYGKPKFINLTIDEDKYKKKLFWADDDFEFFKDLRTDSNTIWHEFVNTYRKHILNCTVL
uniref:Uncharacterized protein n=1 Tax=Clastoptera arizonana TaxID=38151 RepID=A0A1B6CIZ8_9HEMI